MSKRFIGKKKSSASAPAPMTQEQAELLLKDIMVQLGMNEEPEGPCRHFPRRFRLVCGYILKNALILGCVFLLLLLLLPGTLFPASVSEVSAAPSDSMNSARVEFHIGSLIPASRIEATLNDKALKIQKKNYQNYYVDVEENGYLLLQIYTVTGISSSHEFLVDCIDDEAPHISGHGLENGTIKVFLTDGSGSGVDYPEIRSYVLDTGTWQEPLYYDEEAGYVVFTYPERVTCIIIPDKNGNNLTALLSPPESSS